MNNKCNEIMNGLDQMISNPKCSLNYERDYELLIAVMLSAQSTDERVNVVTKDLFKYNLEELSNLDLVDIEKIIRPVGTFHRKAVYIKSISNALNKHYNGTVPHNRDFIESLPGVGHKTCNVVFAELFNEPTMPVDTHITRVSKRLNLANRDDNVLDIERKLKLFFPINKWNKLHLQLVLFGRHYCKALKPKCENCPLKKYCNKFKKK